MNTRPAFQSEAKQTIPRERAAPRSSNSIQKMAVLFTDIVGSSSYFKKHGDLAGREMLRKHQELASGPVTEFGGAVVKVLGDSVMAYFTDPEEALKAAVKIQQKFDVNNTSTARNNHIKVRIALNYGDGIVDKGDIYGDVVNIAAKFLPLVKGGELAVSEQLHNQVKDAEWARFEKLDLNTSEEIFKTLVLYRVTWDGSSDLEPAVMTVVALKPSWNLAGGEFSRSWKRLLDQRNELWPGIRGKHAVLQDGSLILYTKDPSSAPIIARNALRILRRDLGKNADPFIPIQVLIDMGQFSKAGKPSLDKLSGSWPHAKPGEITVSGPAFKSMNPASDFKVIPPGEDGDTTFFRLLCDEAVEQAGTSMFLYQQSMAEGKHEPCYYCGDRRHLPIDCPSKQLPDVTNGLERLGYYSTEQLNEIFFKYLNGRRDSSAPDPSMDLAGHAFFELKNVFQLRFLRALWVSKAETWNGIESIKEDGERGGLVWIGQDCIRVSNLTQAESVLVDVLEKNPGDYLALCAMGFLQVEKGDLIRAKRFFKQALEITHSAPRQIFARFLIARAHELSGEHGNSEEQVRKILHIESACQEARYMDVLFRLRKGSHADGLRRLLNLIEINRKFFIVALIDPELADYRKRIHPELEKILKKAQDQAYMLISKAEEEMERITSLLGGEESELKRAKSYYDKVKEISSNESYFGFLDIFYYSTLIIQIARKSSDNARKELHTAHSTLKNRHEESARFVEGYPYKSLLGSLTQDIAVTGKQVERIRDVIRGNLLERFTESLNLAGELAEVMDRIEQRISRLENLRRWVRFGVDFCKTALLMQGAVVLISLLLFPVVGHYLNFLIPEFKFAPETIWTYQRGVLILGGVGAFILAFMMSARKLGDK